METLRGLRLSADFVRRDAEHHPESETGSFVATGWGGGVTAKFNLAEKPADDAMGVFGPLVKFQSIAYRMTSPERFEMTYSMVSDENGRPIAFREAGYEKTRDASHRDSHETILGAGWCLGVKQSLLGLEVNLGVEMKMNGGDWAPRAFFGADFLVVPSALLANTPSGSLGVGVGLKVVGGFGELIPEARSGLLGSEMSGSVVYSF